MLAPPLLLLACSGTPEPENAASGSVSPEALEDICMAEIRSGALPKFPFAEKLGTLNGWLEQRLADGPGHAFYFESLMQTPVDQQGARLNEEASSAGVERCPMASLLDFLAELPRKGLTTEDCVAACLERTQGLEGVDEGGCQSGCGL